MNQKRLSFAPVLFALLCGTMVGCTQLEASPQETQSSTRVTTIVFIGKERACDCTRNRIDGSWSALQKALGRRRGIRIERLQTDRQHDRVVRFEAMRPIMVLPAVYLLDATGALVEMLQGEITAEQFGRALRSSRR